MKKPLTLPGALIPFPNPAGGTHPQAEII